MLALAVELYETDADALALTHRRYSWFSVDEYQDTNPLQERLLGCGSAIARPVRGRRSRPDDLHLHRRQPDYLATFADRHPGARVGPDRELPQHAAGARAGQPTHPRPRAALDARPMDRSRSSVPHADGDAEAAAVVARIRALLAEGVPVTEIAILVRTNAQLVPFEAALTARRDPVHRARRSLLRAPRGARRPRRRCGAMPTGRLSRDRRGPMAHGARLRRGRAAGDPAPRRATGTRRSSTLLAMARSLEAEQPDATVADFLAELARRDAAEADAGGDGVNLSTSIVPRASSGTPSSCRARGGHAADPPVRLRRRCAGRGAAAALRRHHPRAPPPRAVVGRLSRIGAKGPRFARGRRGSSPSCGRTPSRGRRRSRASAVATSNCPRRTSRCSRAHRVAPRACPGRRRPRVRRGRQQDPRRHRRPPAVGRALALLGVPGIGQRKVADHRRGHLGDHARIDKRIRRLTDEARANHRATRACRRGDRGSGRH